MPKTNPVFPILPPRNNRVVKTLAKRDQFLQRWRAEGRSENWIREELERRGIDDVSWQQALDDAAEEDRREMKDQLDELTREAQGGEKFHA